MKIVKLIPENSACGGKRSRCRLKFLPLFVKKAA